MKIAQIRHGRVSVLYGTAPRTTGFAAALPPDVSLVDVSNIDDIDIGWSATPIDGERWVFAATQDVLDQALAALKQPQTSAQQDQPVEVGDAQ